MQESGQIRVPTLDTYIELKYRPVSQTYFNIGEKKKVQYKTNTKCNR